LYDGYDSTTNTWFFPHLKFFLNFFSNFSRAAGFLTVALEAPFCCAFVDFIEQIAQFSESRAYWQKAALYCIMGAVSFLKM